MWTSGDPLGAVPLVTGILTPPILPLLLLCIVQQPLRAVCCFSSPSTYINQETVCHEHSGSVGVNKRQEPAGETQMTQQCPSNHREQVIFGGVCIYVLCVSKGLLTFVYVSGQTRLCSCEITWVGKMKQGSASFLFKHHHWLCQMACDASSFQSCHWLISHFECIHSHACSSLLLWLCSSLLTPLH